MTADIARYATPAGREVIKRHDLITRITHWINLICLTVLLMSGLQIFNAHPMLHWGVKGSDFDPVLFRFRFPKWSTIPSWQDLSTGRLWHFFFAWLFVTNGLIYLIHGVVSGHFRRDLKPTPDQLAGFRQTVLHHLQLKFPRGEESKRYNVLQKLAYIVVLVLLVLMLLTGLTMSPAMDTAAPWLLTVFGGRQSARTLHFVFAFSIVGFVIVHLIAVLAAGPINEIRSMITGRYVVKPDTEDKA